MKKIILFATIIMVLLSTSAFAATTTYTSEAEFLGHIYPYYLEDFSSYTYGNPFGGFFPPTDADFGPVNGYSWHAYAPSGLWSNDSALSTNLEEAITITFGNSTSPVTAVGGIFSSTELYGVIIPYNVTVALSDGTSIIINTTGFEGFISDAQITSMTVTPDNDNGSVQNWPQIDHFYVGGEGTPPPFQTPEPASLLLLGLGLIGVAGIRRKLTS